MCLLILILLAGPRFGIIVWGLINPDRWERAFDTFVWPLLGFIFLPWTTLMFVAVAPTGNPTGIDWLWLGLTFLLDLFSLGGGFGTRRSVPGYSGY
jgi:hypothetical protein